MGAGEGGLEGGEGVVGLERPGKGGAGAGEVMEGCGEVGEAGNVGPNEVCEAEKGPELALGCGFWPLPKGAQLVRAWGNPCGADGAPQPFDLCVSDVAFARREEELVGTEALQHCAEAVGVQASVWGVDTNVIEVDGDSLEAGQRLPHC